MLLLLRAMLDWINKEQEKFACLFVCFALVFPGYVLGKILFASCTMSSMHFALISPLFYTTGLTCRLHIDPHCPWHYVPFVSRQSAWDHKRIRTTQGNLGKTLTGG